MPARTPAPASVRHRIASHVEAELFPQLTEGSNALGDVSAAHAVHRLRRRYGLLVRAEVRETLLNESDLEDELRYLVQVISE